MPTTFNQSVIEEFRANEGKVGGPFEGADLLLLTTTGARSGTEHTVPLGRVQHGDLLMVVASAGGSPRHPAWYHNLLAHPMVRVETGTETYGAIAVPAEGARRDRLFGHAVRIAPGYGDYQAQTSRTLPVVVLERSEPEDGEGAVAATDLGQKMLEVHTWLRAQLRHVRAEAETYFAARAEHEQTGGAVPAPGIGLQLRQHCLAFCESLEFHHVSEDVHVFPALADSHPHLAGPLSQLAEEHRTVARLQGELLALLEGIGTAEPAVFVGELERMSRELTAHLDFEEESLMPVLARIPLPPLP